ncbi:MAG: hypothetical protein K6L80_09700 [Agarilytica sp.]
MDSVDKAVVFMSKLKLSKKKIKFIYLGFFVSALWGCASPVPKLSSMLEAAPTCCVNFEEMSYVKISGGEVGVKLGPKSLVRLFPEGKSYFSAIELSAITEDTPVQIKSHLAGEFGKLMFGRASSSEHIVSPLFLLLDENKRPLRQFFPSLEWKKDVFGGYYLGAVMHLKPNERYLVMYVNPNLKGQSKAITRYQAGGGYMSGSTYISLPGSSQTSNIPFSVSGEVTLDWDVTKKTDTSGIFVHYLGFEKIKVPYDIPGFEFMGSTSFPALSNGHVYSYSYTEKAERTKFDLYAYPVILYPDVARQYILNHAFATEIYQLKELVKSGFYEKVDLLGSREISFDGMRALVAEFKILDKGKRYHSYVYIAEKNDVFLKVRAGVKEGYAVPEMSKLVEKLMSETEIESDAIDLGAPGITLGKESFHLTQKSKGALFALLIYGASLRQDIEDHGVYGSFEREFKAWTKMMRFVREGKSKSEDWGNTYFDDVLLIEDQGYLQEYVWLLSRFDYWEKPKSLKVDMFLEWAKENLKDHRMPKSLGVFII